MYSKQGQMVHPKSQLNYENQRKQFSPRRADWKEWQKQIKHGQLSRGNSVSKQQNTDLKGKKNIYIYLHQTQDTRRVVSADSDRLPARNGAQPRTWENQTQQGGAAKHTHSNQLYQRIQAGRPRSSQIFTHQ